MEKPVLSLFEYFDQLIVSKCGPKARKWKDNLDTMNQDVSNDPIARLLINRQLRNILIAYGQRVEMDVSHQRYLLDDQCELNSWKHIMNVSIVPFCQLNGVFQD